MKLPPQFTAAEIAGYRPRVAAVDPAFAELAAREWQVLECLLRWMARKQIAAELGISRSSVNQYIGRMFAKLGGGGSAKVSARWWSAFTIRANS